MPENENEAKKDDGTPMSYEQAKQAANDKLTEDEEEAASSEETTTSDDDDKA
jgi:cell division protease FtsH